MRERQVTFALRERNVLFLGLNIIGGTKGEADAITIGTIAKPTASNGAEINWANTKMCGDLWTRR